MKRIESLPWISRLFIGVGLLLAATLPAASVTHVVHMSLDGLGAKYLQFFVTNAPANFPNFNRLIAEGAYTFEARSDFSSTETIPNHLTMFTGRPVAQPLGFPNTTHHGYTLNTPLPGDTVHSNGNPNVLYKSSFFDVAHDYGLSTAVYLGKTRLQICERSYNGTNGAPDSVPDGGDNGRDKIDSGLVASGGDIQGNNITNEVNVLVQDLTNASPRRYSFIHLAEPDLTGHTFNWRSANWSNMVSFVDGQLGRIINAIDANPILSNNTALIVSADHGGGGIAPNNHTESQHVTNYTIPFFLRAPGVRTNSDVYALFSNRGNPGTNRLDYTVVPQPIRNADGGNLALNLLGLPPIPGSFSVPILGATNVNISIARATNGTHTLWWSGDANAFVLECTPSVGPSQWQSITNGVVNNGGMFVYAVTNLGHQFYRLRKL